MNGLEFIFPSTDAPPPRESAPRTAAPRRDASPEQFDAVMGRALARPENDSHKNGSPSTRRSERPRKEKIARSDSAADSSDPPANAASDPTAKAAAATPANQAQAVADSSVEGDAADATPNQAPPVSVAPVGANALVGIDTNGANSNSKAAEADSSSLAVPDLSPVNPTATSKTETKSADPAAKAVVAGDDESEDQTSPAADGAVANENPAKNASSAGSSGKTVAIDSNDVKVLNAQTDSGNASNTASTAALDTGGISAAQEHMPMQKADNMHETAGVPEQNLPVGSASPAKSSRSEGLDLTAAIGAAAGRDSASPGIASAAVSTTTTDTSIVRSIERAHDMMLLHAYRMRDSGADFLHVVIKPGSGLQLSLNLQMRSGGIEVQAQLNHGDFDFLSRHWNELQQQLEARGIRLAALTRGEQTPGDAPDGFRTPNRPKEEDARTAEAFAGLASPRSLVIPPTPVRTKPPRGWESWA